MEISAEGRLQARLYMGAEETRQKTGYLLKKMEFNLSDSDYELVRFSLMQDIVYLDNANLVKNIQTQGFVNSLKEFLHLTSAQINLMNEAVELHSALLDTTNKKMDSVIFEQKMEKLRRGAVLFYMPVSALFCSGGIYAPSTFRSLKRFWEEKKAVSLQRELMLKNIIENNQMTINFLIEDLNQLSISLMKEIQKANMIGLKIEKLITELQRLQQRNLRLEHDMIAIKLLDNKFQKALQQGMFDEYVTVLDSKFVLKSGLGYKQLNDIKSKLERLEEKYA